MVSATAPEYDVVIVGAGPGGTTVGTFLKKYNPGLRVLILEKEKFPREHVGESQLPPIGAILHEMDVWQKVEDAQFPIKIGATYRWGNSRTLWDFEFLPVSAFHDEPRPAKYEGQRRVTAFQVDRAIYDQILLEHAKSLGCEALEQAKVVAIERGASAHKGSRPNDRISAVRIETSDGSSRRVTAKWFVDASGHVGVLRRAMDIPIDVPTKLKNVAMWDYWTNTRWAVHIGVGGTRVQIMSLKHGWIWFIPLGPTRTSIGFICPADYYKTCGKTPEELYAEAIASEPRIAELVTSAAREGKVRTTRDWSYKAERIVGDNWFLVGEAAGFADPILSAGMTLAHSGGREVAYILLEALKAGGPTHDVTWLQRHYNDQQLRRIHQYIRFADYWYSANGQFTDLQQFTTEIAKDAGLDLDAKGAFRWLSFGGFTHEDWLAPGLATFDILAVKEFTRIVTGADSNSWELNNFNVFKLNLLGAKKERVPLYHEGKIVTAEAYIKNGKTLPIVGLYGVLVDVLKANSDFISVYRALESAAAMGAGKRFSMTPDQFIGQCMSTLETLLLDTWVAGKFDPKKPRSRYDFAAGGKDVNLKFNTDPEPSASM
ncbi:MAG: tryptophan 7-halogenase [Phycisphaerae bacterium]|nr:tryptophan 7-halogenase [Phycisphaerae bacterium]